MGIKKNKKCKVVGYDVNGRKVIRMAVEDKKSSLFKTIQDS